ncbi:carbohydrate ABC transporter membrane protein 1 (CUT1 family) [Actinomadura pelletieri DSM 43383]|uniref:Carbohydrate ABC transporter membrane protein 1 (CUT1 family) n=1 Tax=Actinomadura pelletieri DSM 43383 TaxID=1120940 RepID=A0A495QTW0_9ACTN|nr:sugar ABC transporter permease [Actinomadura pelletieri]RKS76962.1 carbohydrate ABC transporter membrane protein 1 (CUT1 family) [Actinomadura pelletieri DSM 43383]
MSHEIVTPPAANPGSELPPSASTPWWRRRRADGPAGGARKPPWTLAMLGIALLIGMHFVAPLAGGVYAFTDWDGFNSAEFVGLENFREIWGSDVQRGALTHTFVLAGSYLVLVNLVGLALALGLNRTLKSRNLLRTIFFAPAVLSPLAVSYIWQYMFTYDGAINRMLGGIGLGSLRHEWLGDPSTAIWCVLVVMVWQHAGQAMIIYLAGLQGVPDELEEAAVIDGARMWMRLRRITLPLLAPAFTIVSTLMLISGLRVFDQVFALTGGGPVYSTETLATQVYQQTFVEGRFGFGASIAMVMTVLISILGIANMMYQRRRERRM